MNKEDNVYFNLAETLRNYNKTNESIKCVNLGVIKSVSPLIVNCNGLQLEREDLLINKNLLKDTVKNVEVIANSVTGSLNTEYGGTLGNFKMSNGTIKNIEDVFKVDDIVVLLTIDNQKFFLISVVI